jgi:hypothetical protein
MQDSLIAKRFHKKPFWRGDLVFTCSKDQIITFEIWDKCSVGKDRFIGSTSLALSKLTDNYFFDWLPLYFKDKTAGQFNVSIHFYPTESSRNQSDFQVSSQPMNVQDYSSIPMRTTPMGTQPSWVPQSQMSNTGMSSMPMDSGMGTMPRGGSYSGMPVNSTLGSTNFVNYSTAGNAPDKNLTMRTDKGTKKMRHFTTDNMGNRQLCTDSNCGFCANEGICSNERMYSNEGMMNSMPIMGSNNVQMSSGMGTWSNSSGMNTMPIYSGMRSSQNYSTMNPSMNQNCENCGMENIRGSDQMAMQPMSRDSNYNMSNRMDPINPFTKAQSGNQNMTSSTMNPMSSQNMNQSNWNSNWNSSMNQDMDSNTNRSMNQRNWNSGTNQSNQNSGISQKDWDSRMNQIWDSNNYRSTGGMGQTSNQNMTRSNIYPMSSQMGTNNLTSGMDTGLDYRESIGTGGMKGQTSTQNLMSSTMNPRSTQMESTFMPSTYNLGNTMMSSNMMTTDSMSMNRTNYEDRELENVISNMDTKNKHHHFHHREHHGDKSQNSMNAAGQMLGGYSMGGPMLSGPMYGSGERTNYSSMQYQRWPYTYS